MRRVPRRGAPGARHGAAAGRGGAAQGRPAAPAGGSARPVGLVGTWAGGAIRDGVSAGGRGGTQGRVQIKLCERAGGPQVGHLLDSSSREKGWFGKDAASSHSGMSCFPPQAATAVRSDRLSRGHQPAAAGAKGRGPGPDQRSLRGLGASATAAQAGAGQRPGGHLWGEAEGAFVHPSLPYRPHVPLLPTLAHPFP